MEPRRIDVFHKNWLPRVEHWVYLQVRGLQDIDVGVVAERGLNLREFPVERLFLAYRSRFAARRVINGFARLLAGRPEYPSMPRSVIRSIEAYWRQRRPHLVYTVFGWNAVRLLDAGPIRDGSIPLAFFAGGSDVTMATALGDHYAEGLHEVFGRAVVILATSRFIADRLVAMGAPREKVKVHYIGVEMPKRSPADRASGGPLRMLAVSRLVPVKGVEHTLRAFAIASRELPGAELEIVGDGPDRKACEKLARELGLGDRVSFRGMQPARVVSAAMERADLLVQHSLATPDGQEEALGLVFLEAAARGLPSIATRSGGIPEVVSHERTGLLVEEGDEDAMARSIVRLGQDAELRRTLGENGRTMVESNFDMQVRNHLLRDELVMAASRVP